MTRKTDFAGRAVCVSPSTSESQRKDEQGARGANAIFGEGWLVRAGRINVALRCWFRFLP